MRNVQKISRDEIVKINLSLASASEAKIVKHPEADAEVYIHPAKLSAMGFERNNNKSSFFYKFANSASMDRFINTWFEGQIIKTRQYAERGKPCELKVGDVLQSSWGHEQTNVDFYQVLAVKGQRVTVQEIESETIESNERQMTSKVIAVPFAFKASEKKITREVVYGTTIKISSYEYADRWDGKPKHASHYG